MEDKDKIRVALTYTNSETSDTHEIEMIWVKKNEVGYEIHNIPFFAKNIACGDIISIEHDEKEGLYHFLDFVLYSGNSVVRIILDRIESMGVVGEFLESLGCSWEHLKDTKLMAIHILKQVDYHIDVKKIEGHPNIIDFQEACIGHPAH